MNENFVNRRKAKRLSEQNKDNEITLKIEIITKDLDLAKAQFGDAVELFEKTKATMIDEVVEVIEEVIEDIHEDIKLVSEDFEELKRIYSEIEEKKLKFKLDRTSHQEKFLTMMENLLFNFDDLEEEVDDLNDEIINLYQKISNSKDEHLRRDDKKAPRFESIEDVSEVINKAFGKLKDTFSFDFSNEKNSRTQTLVSLLPFLDDEELDEIAKMIIDNHEDLKGLKLSTIFPFLKEEQCDAIFNAKMSSLSQSEISSIIPFVSKKVLSKLVDEYLAGRLPKVNMNALYPFLDKEDIKRIFFLN